MLSSLHRADSGQNLLGEGNHQAAEQTEETLCPLAGVVGLDRHTHLHDAPAEDNHAQGLNDGENEVGQVIDNAQRVGACGKGRDGQGRAQGHGQSGGEVEAAGAAVLVPCEGAAGIGMAKKLVHTKKFLLFNNFHIFQRRKGKVQIAHVV